jgi:hypothetical protein
MIFAEPGGCLAQSIARRGNLARVSVSTCRRPRGFFVPRSAMGEHHAH